MRRQRTRAALLLWLGSLALVPGCGGGSSYTDGGASTTRRYGDFIFTFSLPKTVYTLGEPIKGDATVSYVGTERPEVVCLSADTKISQGDQLIWQESKSGGTGGGCYSIHFVPGSTLPGHPIWNQVDLTQNAQFPHGRQVPPGQYTIKTWLSPVRIGGERFIGDAAEQKLFAPPISFTILPK